MIYYIENQKIYNRVCLFTDLGFYNEEFNLSVVSLTEKQSNILIKIKNTYNSFYFLTYSELETFLTGVDL